MYYAEKEEARGAAGGTLGKNSIFPPGGPALLLPRVRPVHPGVFYQCKDALGSGGRVI